ncbi:hypothetical protein GCM10007968_08570 [Sporolactobacillus putidus]|uniref:Uncharacterized protein n=1 Tax=Sporolactobacillus putidus TaxID=492735 RepID=A0A917W0L0_9BACL|nr:hypothetical protein GCM10007968_08570 [Sporolactobacillus putidus]
MSTEWEPREQRSFRKGQLAEAPVFLKAGCWAAAKQAADCHCG